MVHGGPPLPTTTTQPNNQYENVNQDQQQQYNQMLQYNDEVANNASYREEGRIFDPKVNLEEEEGLQKPPSMVIDN